MNGKASSLAVCATVSRYLEYLLAQGRSQDVTDRATCNDFAPLHHIEAVAVRWREIEIMERGDDRHPKTSQ